MPVVDEIAKDYLDEVTFVAVAGRSSLDETVPVAAELFSDRLLWGYDEGLWEAYEVLGQPTTFLVTGDDIVIGGWFGEQSEEFIRDQLDGLVAVG